MLLLIPFLTALMLCWALTGLLLRVLSNDAHRVAPNDRRMHTTPTPVGGGLAVVATLLCALPLWYWPLPREGMIVLACAAGLSLVSALDHYRPVWPVTRLAAQALAVAIMLSVLPDTHRFVETMPWWLERASLALAWLWLINLTNFMDGIDGIAAAEGAIVALGVVAMLMGPLAQGLTLEVAVALTLAGACLGYLVWNWAPAKLFMGDAGSIPIGFLLGWLLLALASRGAWVAALILPLLFVADATLTLLRRLLRGEKPWTPHRMHFYQRAVTGSASPPLVVGLLTACNAVIVLLAVQSLRRPVATLAAALAVAALFLLVLTQWSVAAKTGQQGGAQKGGGKQGASAV